MEPVFFSFGAGVPGIQVEPVLELINCYDPGEDFEDIFELVDSGAQEFVSVREENIPMIHG